MAMAASRVARIMKLDVGPGEPRLVVGTLDDVGPHHGVVALAGARSSASRAAREIHVVTGRSWIVPRSCTPERHQVVDDVVGDLAGEVGLEHVADGLDAGAAVDDQAADLGVRAQALTRRPARGRRGSATRTVITARATMLGSDARPSVAERRSAPMQAGRSRVGWPPCAESWDTSVRPALGRRRRAAPAGVPRLRLGRRRGDQRRRAGVRKKAGKLANLETLLGERPDARLDHRHRPHPLGDPRRPDRPQRPPARRARTAGSPSSTTASSRTSPSCAPSSRPRASSSPATPTPSGRPPARRSELPELADEDLAEAMRRVCRRLEGAFTLLAVDARHPTWSSAPGATRPLVVGVGEGENFLASDVAAFIEHTREAVELGQDQVVLITPDGDRDHRLRRASPSRARPSTSTGTPRPPRRAATTTSCSRRSPSSPGPSPTRCCGRLSEDWRGHARRGAPVRPGSCATSTRSSSWPAAPPTTPGWSPSTPSSTGPGSRRGRAGQRVPLPRPGARTGRTLVVAISQSGETMDTLMALRHARSRRPGCWRSATPTARPSRASPTRCSTPTPARRSRSPRPRRS